MRSAARSTTDCRKTLVSNSLPASKRGMRSSQPLDGPARDCRRSPKPSATGSNVSLFTRRPTLTSVSSEQRGGSSSAQTASVPSMRGGRRRQRARRPPRSRCARSGSSSPRGTRAPGTGSESSVGRHRRRRRCCRCRSRTPLDLEEIGEVRPAAHPQLAADRLGRGVGDRDLLERAAAHEPQATDGDAVGTEARCVGIREEERGGVVVDRTGLEQRERSSVETNLPPAQEARVLVHETSDRAGRHIAARVREHERPPLQDCDRVGAEFVGCGRGSPFEGGLGEGYGSSGVGRRSTAADTSPAPISELTTVRLEQRPSGSAFTWARFGRPRR